MVEQDQDIIEIRFQVEPSCHGWRLDRYLQHKVKRLSRTRIAQVIRQLLLLNGSPAHKPGIRVRRGDELLIRRPTPVEPDVPRTFEVLADGPGYLAVSKPAGLPVHPTARYLNNTLTALIRERYGPDSGINMAHRLDRETSGIVLFGTNPAATRQLKLAFRDGLVQKRYLAVVHGDLAEPALVDLPLGPAPGSVIRIRMGVLEGGQPACTRLEPLRRYGTHTLVQASPVTGRQHQIRVHLEALGHALVGDKLYGHPDDFFLGLIETGVTPELATVLQLERHALHAARIRFPVPDGSGTEAEVEAPLPPDLRRFLQRLDTAAAATPPTPS
ncbi:MAG: RluA family pseudouridine synthase [bacterium]